MILEFQEVRERNGQFSDTTELMQNGEIIECRLRNLSDLALFSKDANAKKWVGKNRKRDAVNDCVNLDNELIYDKIMKCIYSKKHTSKQKLKKRRSPN